MRYDLLLRATQWMALAAIVLYTTFTPGIDCGFDSYVCQEVVDLRSNPLIAE